MNFPRYSLLYSRFHGCTSYRLEGNIIILDFVEIPYNNLEIHYLYEYDVLRVDAQQAFIQAFKVFSKTEATITVACQKESWTGLLGNSKLFHPVTEQSATFQLYATPYFVKDPSVVAQYLQGIARQVTDCIFLYKNCVLYLDKDDLPYPGGCYFQPTESQNLYRICFLSNESINHVLAVASEWDSRRDVSTLSFLTKEVITRPKMIPFQPVGQPYLPEERAISTGLIQSRLSVHRPDNIIQDVINSYYRSYLHAHDGEESLQILQNLGIIMEWPFRVTFEGTRPNPQEEKAYVALSVNGQRPSRVLFVRYPYEVYTEFNEVPSTYWTPIYYVPKALILPDDMEKVSINSVVVGYIYKNAFFCFNFPVLEGRPTYTCSRNVQYLLSVCAPSVLQQSNVHTQESFQLNPQYSLHRVQMNGVPFTAWCVALESSEYPTQRYLPRFVEEWINLFEKHIGSLRKSVVDVTIIQIALILARHKICFEIAIDPKAKGKPRNTRIVATEKRLVLHMGEQEAEFINSNRVAVENDTNGEWGCTIL